MGLDHERLDVYRVAVKFSAWVGDRLEGSLKNSRTSATKHLDEASVSISNNIAEGNDALRDTRRGGKRSLADRRRFLPIARGSALECAACLDTLVARKRIHAKEADEGKELLERIVSMLWRMIDSNDSSDSSTNARSIARPRPRPSTNEHEHDL
jgi:four helix bundle protein